MALSPNYGWSEPDNSSLVKNGAADIRTLGDSIDTSVWNIGFGQAGKNKLINGDFSINQRAFTSTTTTNTYGFDRFAPSFSDGTSTYSAQTFTVGAAPVAGYEATNFARLVSTGQTLNTALTALYQKIENVRTFAGQTITISFWAKASTGTPSVAASAWQEFGFGGSAAVQSGSKVAITTSWARYSVTLSLASISGKTIGSGLDSAVRILLITSAGSTRDAYTGALGIQSATIDFWGIQTEYGSKATPFQTASGGSPQAELAMCQRYYYRNSDSSTNYASFIPAAITSNTTQSDAYLPLPVTMRTKPSSVDFANLQTYDYVAGAGYAISNVTMNSNSSPTIAVASLTFAVATAGRFIIVRGNNSASAYLGFSAEL
jgi:hypothetical protein